jgi:hypothetical protein
MRSVAAMLVTAAVLLAGCFTTQQVTLTKPSHNKPIRTVVQVAADGN